MVEIKNSFYWQGEINKTESELSSIMNGEVSVTKNTSSKEDTVQLQDIDKIIKSKLHYIRYCKDRYSEELEKEKKTTPKKSILYFNREFGY